MKKLVWLPGLAVMTAVQATAQQIPADSATLREVVISATRKASDPFRTPFSILSVHTPANNMQQSRTTPEALAYSPGVFVQKTNHGGGSPFLRGLTGNQTLLMLDGVRFNNATFRFGPNQYTNLIDPFTIQRIEVLKGSGAVQYGSDALGGVIHILTKAHDFSTKPRWFGSVTGRITSQDMEYTARAAAGFATQKLVMEGGYTFRNFGDLYGGDTTGRQSPSGYKERDWNFKLKLKLSAHTSFTAASQQVVQKAVPLYHRVKLEDFAWYRFDPQKMNVSYARLNTHTRHALLQEIELTGIYKRSIESREYHKNGNSNYFRESDDVKTGGVTLHVFSSIAGNWTAGSGIEFYSDHVGSTRERTANGSIHTERGLYPDGASQDNFSVYSLHHISLQKWQLEGGLRYNLFVNKIPAAITQLPGQEKQAATRLTPSSMVGNASASYQLHRQHVVYASFSTGYRAPGIDDMGTLGLVDFRYEIPAYDLQPEKNYNTEAGYRFKNKALELNATVFYMHLSDLISRVATGDSLQGYPVYTKVNDQRAFVRGVEVSGNWDFHPHWSLNSFIAYQYGQNITRHEPMRRVPPANGLTGITYRKAGWYVNAAHQWAARQSRLAQGDKEDNRIPPGGTPGWNLLHLYAGLQCPQWDFRLSGHNLLNEDYRTHGSGINGPGRSVTFTMQYCF